MRVTPTMLWMICSRGTRLLKDWRRGSESNRRIKVLQTSPLPLGYRAILNIVPPGRAETGSSHCDFQTIAAQSTSDKVATWSGRRDLNPRPSPWQGDALPLSYSRITS